MKKREVESKNSLKYEEEELLKDLKHCYSEVAKMNLEKKLYPQKTDEPEYRFVAEDKSSKKVKYIAIGPLNTVNLNFFRIRFRHELMMCINQDSDDGFFYHPMFPGCAEIEEESLKGIPFSEVIPPEESTKTIYTSFK